MRRKQFGKLLTISLSDELYGLIETIAREHRTSMGGVVRDSIENSIYQRGDWAAIKTRPFALVELNDRTPVGEEDEKDER